jgi:hypothetical protein
MSLQADYMIISNETQCGDQKAEILKSQLDDLGFVKDKDYYIFTDKDYNDKLEDDDEVTIYFALRFSGEILDKIADKLQIKTDLDG